jgi:hypothetical protein
VTVAALLAGPWLSGVTGLAPSGHGDRTVPGNATTLTLAPSSSPGCVVVDGPEGRSTITLDDSVAARAFAAQLPMRVELQDGWGQALSAQLPAPIDNAATPRVSRAEVGGVYYWPTSRRLAIYYDDLGQSVPAPGLVRLGSVDVGS